MEPEGLDPVLFKELVTHLILFNTIKVRFAIDLNGEAGFRAVEVQYVWAEGRLTPEPEPSSMILQALVP